MTSPILLAAVLFLSAFFLSVSSIYFVLRYLRHKNIVDEPGYRRSHETPTPRGAGLALVPVLVFVWVAARGMTGTLTTLDWQWTLLVGTIALFIISWVDDFKGHVAAKWRLIVMALAVALPVVMMPHSLRIFSDILPLTVERLILFFGWLWFVNLFNFMDGLDGMSGVHLLTIGVGLCVLCIVGDKWGQRYPFGLVGVGFAGAALGFLWWNWQPAKLFLGDVGSVPTGFLCGGLLIIAAAKLSPWAVAVVPLYYICDGTVTLVRRIANREPFWLPHRKFFFHRAVRGGFTHAQVVTKVLCLNALLLPLAVLTIENGWGLVLALIPTAGLLFFFQTRYPRSRSNSLFTNAG